MAYTPNFTPTYENGWEDLPSENTPITAEALNNYDEAIEHIEDYLEQGGGGSEVEITPTLQSGTKIADYEIDGVPGELYAPTGGGDLSVIAEEYDESENYGAGDIVIYQSKLYKANGITYGTFNPNDWEEITIAKNFLSLGVTSNVADGESVEYSNFYGGYIGVEKANTSAVGNNEKSSRASNAYAIGAYFYKDGYFCKAIQAIAVNDTLTLNTNYQRVSIASEIGQGGGGGGSIVTITPTISTGTKIADYSINGVGGELYAPTGGGGGSALDYSTTEKKVGTWIDGSDLYQYSHVLQSNLTVGTTWTNPVFTIANVDKIVHCEMARLGGGNAWASVVLDCNLNNGFCFKSYASTTANAGSVITVRYTKSS